MQNHDTPMNDSTHDMTQIRHCETLEDMYLQMPNNRYYQTHLRCTPGHSEVEMTVHDQMYHVAGAVHGSVYFKLLDDAAFFAAASHELHWFIVTVSFTTYITRPVREGVMIAHGRSTHVGRNLILAEAEIVDQAGRPLGRGNGSFMRSQTALSDVPAYRMQLTD